MRLGSKLVLQTVLPALIAVAVLLGIVTHVASNALQDAAQRGLAAVADARREGIRSYLERMQQDIVTMGNAPAVIDAMGAFSSAFSACGKAAGHHLQQLYANAGDAPSRHPDACQSGYAQAHARHDTFFRQRHLAYGWHDMLLIDSAGKVVTATLNCS